MINNCWIFYCNYLCSVKCALTKVELLNPDTYNVKYVGDKVVGAAASGGCHSTPNDKTSTIHLSHTESVENTVGMTIAKTNEANWGVTASVEIEASAKFLGSGTSVTAGLAVSAGGSVTWSSAKSTATTKGASTEADLSQAYKLPGAAAIFGHVRQYEFTGTGDLCSIRKNFNFIVFLYHLN